MPDIKFEIPWCRACRHWHQPGTPHPRIPHYAEQQAKRPPPPPRDAPAVPISVVSALSVVGLPPGALKIDVRRAFRLAILDAHPDRGGDPERAREVLAARDVLKKAGRY